MPIKNIGDLKPDPQNPRRRTERSSSMLLKSLQTVGAARSIVIDEEGRILAGNGTVEAAGQVGIEKVKVVQVDGDTIVAVQRTGLTEQQKTQLALYDNRTSDLAEWDPEILQELEEVELTDFWGEGELESLMAILEEGTDLDNFRDDIIPDPDKLEEIESRVEVGEVWRLGRHRIMCGDSTKGEDVAKLMDGAIATLLHADPPYGMGKEKDGVENDNLYREKLDTFQMQWWKAFRQYITDNASAYIWGNAEDLWRLWYVGGLKDSERLTFRNEIVWDKGDAGAGGISHQGAEGLRLFPQSTERCLFFILGEQGFNNNADNYWDGWEPIRAYLAGESRVMKWGAEDVHRICETANTGAGMYSHWFTESQWAFIPEHRYNALQKAANGKAFNREYDDLKQEYDRLKQEWYATRAYFDNTHENMTDVWSFSRVTGEERWGHATPKPVDMLARILKSSSAEDSLIVEPFLGSGSTLIACEQNNRTCYGMEISPKYCTVVLNRWENLTGKIAQRIHL